MDSNLVSDSFVAQLDIDLSSIIGKDTKIANDDIKMLDEKNNEIDSTLSYTIEIVDPDTEQTPEE